MRKIICLDVSYEMLDTIHMYMWSIQHIVGN